MTFTKPMRDRSSCLTKKEWLRNQTAKGPQQTRGPCEMPRADIAPQPQYQRLQAESGAGWPIAPERQSIWPQIDPVRVQDRFLWSTNPAQQPRLGKYILYKTYENLTYVLNLWKFLLRNRLRLFRWPTRTNEVNDHIPSRQTGLIF